MGKYTAFLDVGKTIIDMLKDEIVPEPLEKSENIGICAPNDRGNFVVGLHMYDFSENTAFGRQNPVILPNGYVQNPPTPYTLLFMISIASKAEVMIKSVEETRIMGRIVQMIKDNPILPKNKMPEALKNANEEIEMKLTELDIDNKIKIWSMYNEPYRASVFFDVSPVFIESAVITPPAERVKSFGVENNFRNQI